MKTFFKHLLTFAIGCVIGIPIGGYLTYKLVKGPLTTMIRLSSSVDTRPFQDTPAQAASRSERKEPRAKKRVATSAAPIVKPRTPVAPVPADPEPYDVRLPKFAPTHLGQSSAASGRFELTRITVAPRTQGPDTLAINVRVTGTSMSGTSTMFSPGGFSLNVNGSTLKAKPSFSVINVARGDSQSEDVVFDIPDGTTEAALRIEYFGDSVRIPLDLTQR